MKEYKNNIHKPFCVNYDWSAVENFVKRRVKSLLNESVVLWDNWRDFIFFFEKGFVVRKK